MAAKLEYPWTRRSLLRLGLLLPLAGVAGCAPSPLITPDDGSSPMPAPSMDEPRRVAARAAAGLAELATACAGIAGIDGVLATWLTALAAQHRAHQQVLSQADPLGGVQTDHTPLEPIEASPLPVPGDQAAAMALLATQHAALAETLTPMVTDGTQAPSMALLWISQQLAARVAAAALEAGEVGRLGPAPAAGGAVPAELADPGNATDARQVLLSHQRTLVFGLQALLGRLAHDDPQVDVITARLGQAMRERDATVAAIEQAGGSAEPPAAEYQLPGDPTDASQRSQIWGRLELAVLAGWARLAAVDDAERTAAVDQAAVAAGRTRAQGIALTHWPGWV